MTTLLGILLFAALLFGARWAIRHGLRAPRAWETVTPDARGLAYRTVEIPTANGRRLHGWYIAGAGAGEGTAVPAVAILHGWGGNAETMLPLAGPLQRAGYAVLLFDARNHGMSDADSFASLPRFAEDLDHAVAWLRRQPGIDAARVAAIGHSVGAGAALLLAAQCQALAAVVSIAAFAHPRTMMQRWLAQRRIPYWPLGWAVLAYVQHAIGARFDHIAPSRTIAAVRCPVLIAHGTHDATVPVAEAREIHANRAHENVELLLLPGSHDSFAGLEHGIAAVTAFLDRSLQAEAA
jgi:dipeptidyl aminopeptidase/acylaminoacyl peptidase